MAVILAVLVYVVYKINKYTWKYQLPSGKHLLLYGTRDKELPYYFQYIGEYTKKDIILPIFNKDTIINTIHGMRTSDKILVENGIESIQDVIVK